MVLKRLFDILLAALLIITSAPVWIAVSAAILIETGFPVFYRSIRVGKNEKKFRLLKFRSMIQNADELGASVTREGDWRVTRVGGFIRKWKVDELPNLINVVKGDMSIVGPRPESPKYVEFYNEHQKKSLSVKPGITDPAAAGTYRNEAELLKNADDPENYYINKIMNEKIDKYINYVENSPSMLLDIKIILKTSFSILFR